MQHFKLLRPTLWNTGTGTVPHVARITASSDQAVNIIITCVRQSDDEAFLDRGLLADVGLG